MNELDYEDQEFCYKCGKLKCFDEFRIDLKLFVSRWCKECSSKYSRKYKKAVRQATPIWADKELMKLVCEEARYRKLVIDHIVPILSENVCGLHVYWNTQLLSASGNVRKGNKWPYTPQILL